MPCDLPATTDHLSPPPSADVAPITPPDQRSLRRSPEQTRSLSEGNPDLLFSLFDGVSHAGEKKRITLWKRSRSGHQREGRGGYSAERMTNLMALPGIFVQSSSTYYLLRSEWSLFFLLFRQTTIASKFETDLVSMLAVCFLFTLKTRCTMFYRNTLLTWEGKCVIM